jgi:hypothetical protein
MPVLPMICCHTRNTPFLFLFLFPFLSLENYFCLVCLSFPFSSSSFHCKFESVLFVCTSIFQLFLFLFLTLKKMFLFCLSVFQFSFFFLLIEIYLPNACNLIFVFNYLSFFLFLSFIRKLHLSCLFVFSNPFPFSFFY